MCVAWLEQPRGFSWHEAQPNVGIVCRTKDGGVQMHRATIEQQDDLMGRSQVAQGSGQPFQCRTQDRVVHPA